MQRLNIGITSLFAMIAIAGWAEVAHYIYILGWYTPPTVHLIVPCIFSLLAAIGWLILTRRHDYGGYETRCRKCRYVLRGITQPRCPECGEAI